jgi:hypothetical protein
MVSPMKIDALWLSQRGTRTPDNLDHAGLAARPGEFLGIVVDGSTSGATNGNYARAVVKVVVDWFERSRDEWTADLHLICTLQTGPILVRVFRRIFLARKGR